MKSVESPNFFTGNNRSDVHVYNTLPKLAIKQNLEQLESGDYIFLRGLPSEPWHKINSKKCSEEAPIDIACLPYHYYNTKWWKELGPQYYVVKKKAYENVMEEMKENTKTLTAHYELLQRREKYRNNDRYRYL